MLFEHQVNAVNFLCVVSDVLKETAEFFETNSHKNLTIWWMLRNGYISQTHSLKQELVRLELWTLHKSGYHMYGN